MNENSNLHLLLSLWSRVSLKAVSRWKLRLWAQMLGGVLLISAAHAQTSKRLWVLREPNEIIEYDVGTLAVRHTMIVPRRLIEHPEYLSINAKGQILFFPPKMMESGNGETVSCEDRMWWWNGDQVKEMKLEVVTTRGGSADSSTITTRAAQWFLSVGGDSPFRFEETFEKVVDKSGVERSVRITSEVSHMAPAGKTPETIAKLSSTGWCHCATGVCSETCPKWEFWAPDNIVGEFFVMTRVTTGQLESTYHESLLYQRSGLMWQAKKLSQPVQRPLDASEKGEILVAAVPDGGCCGWENEGNDQMVLLWNGKLTVLYDESARYRNRNYDVSFYIKDARLAPDNSMLAYTLVSTLPPGDRIRLSADGKENAEESARVRTAIDELPAVEVEQLGTPPQVVTTFSHAELIGWVSHNELLIVQGGRLTIYDMRGNRRETKIRVRRSLDAFLR